MQEPKFKEDQDIIMNLSHGDFNIEAPQGDIAYLNDIQGKLNKEWRLL